MTDCRVPDPSEALRRVAAIRYPANLDRYVPALALRAVAGDDQAAWTRADGAGLNVEGHIVMSRLTKGRAATPSQRHGAAPVRKTPSLRDASH